MPQTPFSVAALQAPIAQTYAPDGSRLVIDAVAGRLWRQKSPHTAFAPQDDGPAWCAPALIRFDRDGAGYVLERGTQAHRVRRLDGGPVAVADMRDNWLDLACGPQGPCVALAGAVGRGPRLLALGPDGPETLVELPAAWGPDLAIAAAKIGWWLLQGERLWRWAPETGLSAVAHDPALAPAPGDVGCLAVDPLGRLCITRAEAEAITRFDPTSGRLTSWVTGEGWRCRCAGECLHAPGAPAFDAAGRLQVIDARRQRMVAFPAWAE